MTSALTCPHCAVALQPKKLGEKIAWTCPACSGISFNLAVLRDEIDSAVVAQFWQLARSAPSAAVHCPSCRRALRLIAHRTVRVSLDADICVPCQLVWLDGGELDLIQQAAPRRKPARIVRRSTPALDRVVNAPLGPSSSGGAGDVLDMIINIIFTSVV
jgi:Zn-finger nucleic acid-binding protein